MSKWPVDGTSESQTSQMRNQELQTQSFCSSCANASKPVMLVARPASMVHQAVPAMSKPCCGDRATRVTRGHLRHRKMRVCARPQPSGEVERMPDPRGNDEEAKLLRLIIPSAATCQSCCLFGPNALQLLLSLIESWHAVHC